MTTTVFLHDAGDPFSAACRAAVATADLPEAESPALADVALAPLLTRILKPAELALPRLGTLVFHPSLLPRHRGPDALRWAVNRGEEFTGVTWFWADAGLDTGDICEQEVIPIPAGWKPREVYEKLAVPAGLRCLRRALAAIVAGVPRRVPQDHTAATYETFWRKAHAAVFEASAG